MSSTDIRRCLSLYFFTPLMCTTCVTHRTECGELGVKLRTDDSVDNHVSVVLRNRHDKWRMEDWTLRRCLRTNLSGVVDKSVYVHV